MLALMRKKNWYLRKHLKNIIAIEKYYFHEPVDFHTVKKTVDI